MNHKAFTIIGCILAIVLFSISCFSTTAEPQSTSPKAGIPAASWYHIEEYHYPQQNREANPASVYLPANSHNHQKKCYRCAAAAGTPSKKVTLFKPFSIGLYAIALSVG